MSSKSSSTFGAGSAGGAAIARRQQVQSNGDRSLHPLTLPSNRPWM
jgi:hypothetical protein